MNDKVKPRIVISKCLGFENCRYDGKVISAPFVKKLEPLVEFITVCPEVEIGLGVPRDPIRIIESGEGRRLVQPASGGDVTAQMREFAGSFLDSLGSVDGFMLKSRSPSCGFCDVKIYSGPDEEIPVDTGVGFFAGTVLQRFDGWAMEDEERISDPVIAEQFLAKLYERLRFRSA